MMTMRSSWRVRIVLRPRCFEAHRWWIYKVSPLEREPHQDCEMMLDINIWLTHVSQTSSGAPSTSLVKRRLRYSRFKQGDISSEATRSRSIRWMQFGMGPVEKASCLVTNRLCNGHLTISSLCTAIHDGDKRR